MTQKSDNSVKFDKRFRKVAFFLPQYIHYEWTDIGSMSRKIRLEQKSMTAKLVIEGKK